MTNQDKIKEIQEALEKATPGPWKWVDVYKINDFEKYNMGGFVNEEGKLICHFGNRIDYYPTEGEPPDYYDELMIANAPEWLRFLISEIDRLKEENERLKNGGWISVKDRLPNIGDTVLSIDRDRDQVVAVFDGSAFFDDHGMGAGIKHFTHWMPLPEPPEKGA